MLSNELFVRESLEDNLFYLRTIGEFSTNIQSSFFGNNENYIKIAEDFSLKYEDLLRKIVKIANNKLPEEAINSHMFVTDYTLRSEELTKKLFNINIDTSITEQEYNLKPGTVTNPSNELITEIDTINKLAYNLTENFIEFCKDILGQLESQDLFSYSFPSLFEFMILEAQNYLKNLDRLINRNAIDPTFVAGYQYMYNISMRDIAIFIRDLVDSKYTNVLTMAQEFIVLFNNLIHEYEITPLSPYNQKVLADKSLEIVNSFRQFLSNIINKLLNKELYFIVEPIFFDNMYTEANYFKYILETEEKGITQ